MNGRTIGFAACIGLAFFAGYGVRGMADRNTHNPMLSQEPPQRIAPVKGGEGLVAGRKASHSVGGPENTAVDSERLDNRTTGPSPHPEHAAHQTMEPASDPSRPDTPAQGVTIDDLIVAQALKTDFEGHPLTEGHTTLARTFQTDRDKDILLALSKSRSEPVDGNWAYQTEQFLTHQLSGALLDTATQIDGIHCKTQVCVVQARMADGREVRAFGGVLAEMLETPEGGTFEGWQASGTMVNEQPHVLALVYRDRRRADAE